MAKHDGLSSTPAPSALAKGAARFAEIARTVKAQQIAEQQGIAASSVPMQDDAPDEIWARKFMSQAIGPGGSEPASSVAPVWHAPAVMPEITAFRQALVHRQDFSPRKHLDLPPRPDGGSMSLGGQFGKDAPPRRSWLGRMFRRA